MSTTPYPAASSATLASCSPAHWARDFDPTSAGSWFLENGLACRRPLAHWGGARNSRSDTLFERVQGVPDRVIPARPHRPTVRSLMATGIAADHGDGPFRHNAAAALGPDPRSRSAFSNTGALEHCPAARPADKLVPSIPTSRRHGMYRPRSPIPSESMARVSSGSLASAHSPTRSSIRRARPAPQH